MQVIDKLLAHPFAFFLVAVGIAIILYSVGKFAQYPFQFIIDLVKIFIDEFDLTKEHSSLERMDAAIIALVFVISIICLFIECSPNALDQCVGGSSPNFPWLTFATFIIFFTAIILSPLWIYLLQQEKIADGKARKFLKEND